MCPTRTLADTKIKDGTRARTNYMTTPLRILVVGVGSPNADMVAEVLNANGFRAQWTDKIRFPSPFLLHEFDLVYGIYLQTCSRYIIAAKLLGKKTIIHFVGSDAYWFARERSLWRRIYWKTSLASDRPSVVCLSTSRGASCETRISCCHFQ